MAQMTDTFAANIDCPDEDKAKALHDAILETLEEHNEEEYVEIPDYISVHSELGKWYLYIAGHNGLSERIPTVIQEHFGLWDNDHEVIISGAYGCSKLRPDHFGGWACGITASSVNYVSADSAMREILSGKC